MQTEMGIRRGPPPDQKICRVLSLDGGGAKGFYTLGALKEIEGINRIQATSTRGVYARIRRVAGCATPTGSAGHAGATANLKLTFHLDHSAGADHIASGGDDERVGN